MFLVPSNVEQEAAAKLSELKYVSQTRDDKEYSSCPKQGRVSESLHAFYLVQMHAQKGVASIKVEHFCKGAARSQTLCAIHMYPDACIVSGESPIVNMVSLRSLPLAVPSL